MGLDPLLVHGYAPNNNIGPDFSKALQNAGAMWDLDAAKKQSDQTNALKNILGQPGALDANGNPTADALGKVTAVSPELGIKFRQNALKTQTEQLHTQMLMSDLFQKKNDTMSDAYGPIAQQYKDNIAAGMPEAQAREAANKSLTEQNQTLTQGGLYSGEEQKRFPTQFDPAKFDDYAAGSEKIANLRKQRREDERLADEKRRGDLAEHHASVEENRQDFSEPKHVAVTDKDGKETTMDAIWQKSAGRWVSVDGHQPLEGDGVKVREVKEPAEGSNAADLQQARQTVDADPDWKTKPPAERQKEAERQLYGFTEEETQNDVDMFISSGGTLKPSFGFGKAGVAQRQQYKEVFNERLKQLGLDAAEIPVIGAQYAASKGALKKLTEQQAAIETFSRTAVANGKVLVDLAKRVDATGLPVIERWRRAGMKSVEGDADVSAFDAQLLTYKAEAAKILSNPNMTGVLTDEARKEVGSVIPPGATAEQIERVTTLLEGDFGRRDAAAKNEIKEIVGGMRRNSGLPFAAGAAKADAAKPDQGGAKADPADKKWPAPADSDATYLKANPGMKTQFDGKFGPGAADKILGGAAATPAPAAAAPAAPPAKQQGAAAAPPAATPVKAGGYQEGMTATNPKTGQKMIFKNGEWTPLTSTGPAA